MDHNFDDHNTNRPSLILIYTQKKNLKLKSSKLSKIKIFKKKKLITKLYVYFLDLQQQKLRLSVVPNVCVYWGH